MKAIVVTDLSARTAEMRLLAKWPHRSRPPARPSGPAGLRRWHDRTVLTDDDIAAMSVEQRRALIGRLAAASGHASASGRRRVGPREVHLAVLVVSAIVRAPWIAYLAATLPSDYTVHHWKLAWVGFDSLLMVLIVATLVLGFRRRLLSVPLGFTTGVLLVCDAGFDLLTSHRAGIAGSAATAIFVELPLALLLIAEAVRLLRVVPAPVL
jgi:hypothetical protein